MSGSTPTGAATAPAPAPRQASKPVRHILQTTANTAARPVSSQPKNDPGSAILIGALVGGVVFLMIIYAIFWIRRQQRLEKDEQNAGQPSVVTTRSLPTPADLSTPDHRRRLSLQLSEEQRARSGSVSAGTAAQWGRNNCSDVSSWRGSMSSNPWLALGAPITDGRSAPHGRQNILPWPAGQGPRDVPRTDGETLYGGRRASAQSAHSNRHNTANVEQQQQQRRASVGERSGLSRSGGRQPRRYEFALEADGVAS